MPPRKARGLPEDGLKLIEPPAFPMSSWSLDYDIAEGFAKGNAGAQPDGVGVIYYIEIPKSAFPCVLSTALTGFGEYSEEEFVLMLPEGQKVWAGRLPE